MINDCCCQPLSPFRVCMSCVSLFLVCLCPSLCLAHSSGNIYLCVTIHITFFTPPPPYASQVIKVLILEQKTFSRDPSNPQSTYTLNSLARMAGVLGPEFLPYLDDAVKPLLQGLSLDAEIKVSSASSAATAREQLEEAGLTPLEMDVRGLGRQLFGVNTSLMQAKESACRALFQYTDDLGEGFAAHARETLLAVLPNLGPRNAVAVQVVSAAIVPRLVGMVSRRASDFLTGEAQTILDLSIRSLCEVRFSLSPRRGY